MSGLLYTLRRTLAELPSAPSYLLAYSGGVDSHVLLHALHALGEPITSKLRAVYIDHGLQATSAAWGAHCAQVCADLSLPLQILKATEAPAPGDSTEAWARAARYRLLAEHLKPGEMLLTAQHQDDQAETLLLQLLRGSGVAGLAGMPLCRAWQGGWHARPLLAISQADILNYANQAQLAWIEDASNQDTAFDRNYLRQQIMPQLKARWPAAAATLARSAAHLAEAKHQLASINDTALAEQAMSSSVFDLTQLPERSSGPTGDTSAMDERASLLRHWLQHQSVSLPSSAVMAQLLRQLDSDRADARVEVVWGRWALRRYRQALYLEPAQLPAAPEPELTLAWKGEPMVLPHGAGELQLMRAESGLPQAWFVAGRVQIRWGGAEQAPVQLAGRAGSRSWKKLCQTLGVPTWHRDYLPLITVDDQVVSIAGLAWCEGPWQQTGGWQPVWSGPAWAGDCCA